MAARSLLFYLLLATCYLLLPLRPAYATVPFDSSPPVASIHAQCIKNGSATNTPSPIGNGSTYPCNGDQVRLDVYIQDNITNGVGGGSAAFAKIGAQNKCALYYSASADEYITPVTQSCSTIDNVGADWFFDVTLSTGPTSVTVTVEDYGGNLSSPVAFSLVKSAAPTPTPTPGTVCNSGCTTWLDSQGNNIQPPDPAGCTGNTYLRITHNYDVQPPNPGHYNVCGKNCPACDAPGTVSADRCTCTVAPTPTPLPACT